LQYRSTGIEVRSVVSVAPERLLRDAEDYFKASAAPDSLAFANDLSPLHQRLFAVELWSATARAALETTPGAVDDLVELVEAWEATAELEASPELLERIRAPKDYREVHL
jgi:hypothetical protein